MPIVNQTQLRTGLLVWYRYETIRQADGPFKVTKLYRNHEGNQAILVRNGGTKEKRYVNLAEDEDYGALIFYDTDPAKEGS